MTLDTDFDPAATAAYTAGYAELFPDEHPGQVRTLDDDDTPSLTGVLASSSPKLEDFTIDERLGRGSTGEVYRACDRIGRSVALKFVRTGSEYTAVRLEGEARLMARCSHPNIVKVHHVVSQANTGEVLVMEHIDGVTFDTWLHVTPRSPREILRVLGDVGRALEAAHDAGVIHRDIQPTNIMVDKHGHAKLIDFGLANTEQNAATHDSPMVGTYDYIAPEHRDGAACTSRSDQYSFCVVLHEALFGRLPDDRSAPRIPTRPLINPNVRAALRRGLAVDPQRRWPSMHHLLQELARPWWRQRHIAYLTIFLLGILCALGLRYSHESAVSACTQSLSRSLASTRRYAEMMGITSEIDLMLGDPADECRRALAARPERVRELDQCLEAQSDALASLHTLRLDDADLYTREPRIRMAWGQLRAPLPLLAHCNVDPALLDSPEGHASHVHLNQLRIFLQHQQYSSARRLLENTKLLTNLEELGAHEARAEALLYATQVARRFSQQDTDVDIVGLDTDALLELAEIAAASVSRDDLRAAVALERVHRTIDHKDHAEARRLLDQLAPNGGQLPAELQIRLHQAHARLAAIHDPLGAAKILGDAISLAAADPRLGISAVPVELLALRALYHARVDPKHAHRDYVEAIDTARRTLSLDNYLTGVIAANAMRNAFAVNELADGRQWGEIALRAFQTPFGTRHRPAQQIAYDLGLSLMTVGESEEGLKYADRALGLARQLGIAEEVAFTLQLRSILEMRTGRFEAARRSADEAIESMPDELAGDPQWQNFFELGLLTTNAENSASSDLALGLHDLQTRLDRDPSSAFLETRLEVRILRAQVLARLGRMAESKIILDSIKQDELGESLDSLTRADVHMLRAAIAEQLGEPQEAKREACTAISMYKTLNKDGRDRLTAAFGAPPHNHPAPSISLLQSCSLSPGDLLESCSPCTSKP